MIAGCGVHWAFHAASAAGSDCAVDHVSAIEIIEAVAKARTPRIRSRRGENRRAEETTEPLRGEGKSMSPNQKKKKCRRAKNKSPPTRLIWVGQAAAPRTPASPPTTTQR